MKVVVGLGNPGAKYAGTRHNVGFDVIDYLAQAPGRGPFRARFHAQVAEYSEAGTPVVLVKPETFMNLSGRAVRQVADFYKVTHDNVFVICDDFNLPLGKLRVRTKGSHGGQNGLRSIQECLGTDEYSRLRIGVGTPAPGEAVDFVLSRFKPTDKATVQEAVTRAAHGVLIWLRDGIEACMNAVNAAESTAPKKTKHRPG